MFSHSHKIGSMALPFRAAVDDAAVPAESCYLIAAAGVNRARAAQDLQTEANNGPQEEG